MHWREDGALFQYDKRVIVNECIMNLIIADDRTLYWEKVRRLFMVLSVFKFLYYYIEYGLVPFLELLFS